MLNIPSIQSPSECLQGCRLTDPPVFPRFLSRNVPANNSYTFPNCFLLVFGPERLGDDDGDQMMKELPDADGAAAAALTLRLPRNSISAWLYITASLYQRRDNTQPATLPSAHPSSLIYPSHCSSSANLLLHRSGCRLRLHLHASRRRAASVCVGVSRAQKETSTRRAEQMATEKPSPVSGHEGD